MKKILLVGAVGTGKTTLMQNLQGRELSYRKTQGIEKYLTITDTPGEFTQRRRFYHALQVSSLEVDLVCLLQSVNQEVNAYPPGFTSLFTRPSVGIITKIDLAPSETSVDQAESALKASGVSKIFKVSALTNQGIDQLKNYLKEN